MNTNQTKENVNDQQPRMLGAAGAEDIAKQPGRRHSAAPIEELLKNKIVKISFAEVAEYLRQVIAENTQECTRSSATSDGAVPPAEKAEGVHSVPK